ncbi:MAG: Rrf2 family transcriptional regulator [Phycisphaerales bacterium]|nr:Rrf2 family transcriptional regulator [Phycisphaerales bacterium]
MYGKQTETAIAAVSRLAELYDGGKTRLSAAEIAKSRGLPVPVVSKILGALAQAGLVTGSRGPGGGYTLAKPPSSIKIYDVFCLFEREDLSTACPFGGGTCGVGEDCPLHHRLVQVKAAMDQMLHETTFQGFAEAGPAEQRAPGNGAPPASRASYRATKPR